VETTQKKQSLLCPESYKILEQKMEIIYRILSDTDKVQYAYESKEQHKTFGVSWKTFDNIKQGYYAKKGSVVKVIEGFGMQYDKKVWFNEGVIKIVQDGN